MGEKDFKKVLGDLGVYLSRDGFRILWTAVDFDLRLIFAMLRDQTLFYSPYATLTS